MNVNTFSAIQADTILLRDERGDSVKLPSLWAEKAAALVFVRHFG